MEERLNEERQELKKAETEARSAAEQAARERADMEAKLRAEAEERARVAAEGQARAEMETKRLREAEARARVEAEVAAKEREESAKRLAAERQVMIEKEARAKVEAEERARREKQEAEERAKREKEQQAKVEAERREFAGKIEAEKKAREQAEIRAKAEAQRATSAASDERARLEEALVSDMSKKSELEAKAQARALMEAKLKAEQEEEDKMRADQEQRARDMAQILRTKVTPDEEAPEAEQPRAKRKAKKKRGALLKTLVAIVVVGFAIALLGVHVIPLNSVKIAAQKSLSGWLHDDVSIQSAKYWLFPTPHLKVEGVAVGKQYDAKASGGNIYVDYSALWSDKARISSVELAGVTLSNEAVRRILEWGKPEGKREFAEIRSIRLVGVKIDVKPEVEPFNANLQFDQTGKLTHALIQGGGKWTLSMKPIEGGMDLDFNARYWNLPIGAPFPISDVRLKGELKGSEILVPEFEASAMEGKVNGTLRVNWEKNIKMESELSVAKLKVSDLMGSLTRDISINGKLDGNFSMAAESTNLEGLLNAPRTTGKFMLRDGSFSNADLVAVMQSDAAGQRAGVTKFLELSGEFIANDQRVAFRNLTLQGGVLRGNGSLDIGANSALNGRLSLEIRSQVAQDRGTFTVGGTVAKPSIRRGG